MDFDPASLAEASPSPLAFSVIGDGAADDTLALQVWADFCSNNGLDTVCAVTLNCKITDTVTFNGGSSANNIDISRISIAYDGAQSKPAIKVARTFRKEIRIGQVVAVTESWGNDAYIGVQLCDIHGSNVHLKEINGFTEGYELESDVFGCAYNSIWPGTIRDCKYSEVLRTVSETGYVNENTFYSGSYGNTSNSDAREDGYGVWLTRTGENSYSGHNNNVWVHPSFELGGAGAAGEEPPEGAGSGPDVERIPFYFHGVGTNNYCIKARSEFNNGPFAKLDADGATDAACSNVFDLGFNSNALQVNALSQINGAWGNIMTSPGSTAHRWESGDLRTLFSSHGGADAPYIRGPLFFMESSPAISSFPSRTATLSGHVCTARDAIHLIATGIFVAVDTTQIDTFCINLNAVPGFGGRAMIMAFNSEGARLTGTIDDEQYVKSAALLTPSPDYNGGYATSADSDAVDLTFTVRPEVTKIYVGYVGGSNALAARSFSVTGFGSDDTNANVLAVTAMRVFADVDDTGSELLATAKPDTAGTHGYYEKGQIVFNASAAVSATAGWQCSTSGWLAAPWVGSTHYRIVGLIVTNDSGKMYELVKAGTSGTTGGPVGNGAAPAWAASTVYAVDDYCTDGGNLYRCIDDGTSSSVGPGTIYGGLNPLSASITDGGCVWTYVPGSAVPFVEGSCEWRYVGTKAAFVTLPVTS
jgi:hypothetical protein